MEELTDITRWLHIAFGVMCMTSGAIALLAKKRQGVHPLSGRVFFISLTLLFVAILPNILMDTNLFMLGIGWLAVYAGATGWRALLRFRGTLPQKAFVADYLLNGMTLGLSAVLIYFGAKTILGSGNLMGLVAGGFGFLGISLCKSAWKRLNSPMERSLWLVTHIRMMTGAFSAALTAFFAIQFSGNLGGFEWVVWVAPTVIMMKIGEREIKRRGLNTPLEE